MSTGIESAILSRVVDPGTGDLPPDFSQFVLKLDFAEADQRRMAELSTKAQDGTLTREEEQELDGYLNVNDFLTIMQSKARMSLHPS